MFLFIHRRRSIEKSISAPTTMRIQDARRRVRFLPRGEELETRLVLSNFRVNTTLDTVAVNLKNGKDASGHISLRSAIQAANARPSADTILLPKGTITLSIAGSGEDNSASGDLDIAGTLTIRGKNASQTIIDGDGLDRDFQVFFGNVKISGVTIQDGAADQGGGLLNSGGNVTLSSVVIKNNFAAGTPGIDGAQGHEGIQGAGGNGVDGTDGGNAFGGGIFNAAGSLSLSKCTITSNFALGGNGGDGGAGGIGEAAGGGAGVNGHASVGGSGGAGGGGGAGRGGGVYNAVGASLVLSATTFSNNGAVGGQGGQGGSGGDGDGSAGGNDNGAGAGAGGSGSGGAGGGGGRSGPGEGGGLFNLGATSLNGGLATFSGNQAESRPGGDGSAGGSGFGGRGGNGENGRDGSADGGAAGGAGGQGGAAGGGEGGGVLNGPGASFTGTAAVVFSANQAVGGRGGDGGDGFQAICVGLETGTIPSAGSVGGSASGGKAGAGGSGGGGIGGGLFNFTSAVVSITAPKRRKSPILSSFTANQAIGGAGGTGGTGGSGGGGEGGEGGTGDGAPGGFGVGGLGGAGGAAGRGSGGGLFNEGTASFTGITVNFSANQANGSSGGQGGDGGQAVGGNGGDGAVGGAGGNAFSGAGGSGGSGGGGSGGGIDNDTGGVLTINPRLGAKKGSKQAKATSLVTTNQANLGQAGAGGARGNINVVATGGSPGGTAGQTVLGNPGTAGLIGTGLGGGLDLEAGGTATIDNTTITGNTASTNDNNVDGTF